MAEIVHRIRFDAEPSLVFRALREDELLQGVWKDIALRREELVDGARVSWRCIGGPPEWIDTRIAFDVQREGRETVLRLSHAAWRATSDAMADCATRWARVLFALKTRVETPEPEDVRV